MALAVASHTHSSGRLYLGEGLLVVVFQLQGVNVELVLVGGEGVVVLGLHGEELLDLHGNPLAAVLEGFDGDVGGRHRVCGTESSVRSEGGEKQS